MIKITVAYVVTILAFMAACVYAPHDWVEETFRTLLFFSYSNPIACVAFVVLFLYSTHLATYLLGRIESNSSKSDPFYQEDRQ